MKLMKGPLWCAYEGTINYGEIFHMPFPEIFSSPSGMFRWVDKTTPHTAIVHPEYPAKASPRALCEAPCPSP